MSFGYIILDFYIQAVEGGAPKADAAKTAIEKINRFEDRLEVDEKAVLQDIIDRLSRI